jgi:hypothetical protein
MAVVYVKARRVRGPGELHWAPRTVDVSELTGGTMPADGGLIPSVNGLLDITLGSEWTSLGPTTGGLTIGKSRETEEDEIAESLVNGVEEVGRSETWSGELVDWKNSNIILLLGGSLRSTGSGSSKTTTYDDSEIGGLEEVVLLHINQDGVRAQAAWAALSIGNWEVNYGRTGKAIMPFEFRCSPPDSDVDYQAVREFTAGTKYDD